MIIADGFECLIEVPVVLDARGGQVGYVPSWNMLTPPSEGENYFSGYF